MTIGLQAKLKSKAQKSRNTFYNIHNAMVEDRHSHGYFNEYDRKRRMMALTHYGGATPVCACCNENRIEFLCIDHIRGGGKQHLLSLGKGAIRGNSLYRWLYKNNYPPGFRVLCYNCNLSRGFYGYCPHEGAEKVAQVKANKEIASFVAAAFNDLISYGNMPTKPERPEKPIR